MVAQLSTGCRVCPFWAVSVQHEAPFRVVFGIFWTEVRRAKQLRNGRLDPTSNPLMACAVGGFFHGDADV